MDYNRREFRLSQALWSASNQPQLVTVPPSGAFPYTVSKSAVPGARPRSQAGLIAGVVVGVVVLIAALALARFCLHKRRRRQRAKIRARADAADAELREKHEREQNKMKGELDATQTARGIPRERLELEGRGTSRPDKYAAQMDAVELDNQQEIIEVDQVKSPREMEAPSKPVEMPTHLEQTYLERNRQKYSSVSTEDLDEAYR